MQALSIIAGTIVAAAFAAAALAQEPRLVSEDMMVPSDPGIEVYVRNKRPADMTAFRPERTVLFVHGSTFPSHTGFDLKLGGMSWMDYIWGLNDLPISLRYEGLDPQASYQVRVVYPKFPRSAAQAKIRLRAFSGGDGTVSLRVNENKDINGKLARGWSTVELTVPAGQLKEGENALQLFMKSSGVELAWMQIGGAAPVGDDGAAAFYDAIAAELGLGRVIERERFISWGRRGAGSRLTLTRPFDGADASAGNGLMVALAALVM